MVFIWESGMSHKKNLDSARNKCLKKEENTHINWKFYHGIEKAVVSPPKHTRLSDRFN